MGPTHMFSCSRLSIDGNATRGQWAFGHKFCDATASVRWRKPWAIRYKAPARTPNVAPERTSMTLQSDNDTLITVFGGSGFLGRHLIRALARRHYRIRVAVRRPDLAGPLQPLGRVGQIHPVQANPRHAASVEAGVRGADVVVNLVGILFERGRQRFDTVQGYGAEQVALAASAHGARMVHVSAIGADEHSASAYARAKADGEKAVLAARPEAVIVRPSIMFGPEGEFFNKFAAMARLLPALPLIGGGETKFQPVFVGDVAEAIARTAEGNAKAGTIYEAGGPEMRSFKQ